MSTCSANPHAVPSKPLPSITVNGELIDESQLAQELQYHQGSQFELVLQQAAQALVIKSLLLQQANKLGVKADDDEQKISELLNQQVQFEQPDESYCERYFQQNSDKFVSSPLIEVRHILLPAAPDDASARDDAKQLADQLIHKIQADPNQFPHLAQQYSACPSKEVGGSLGQITKGQTVAEFERQIAKLPQGFCNHAIETRYGFHIVDIIRKVEGKQLEYSMVKDKIKGFLASKSSRLAIQAYIHELAQQADIQGFELQFADENVVNMH